MPKPKWFPRIFFINTKYSLSPISAHCNLLCLYLFWVLRLFCLPFGTMWKQDKSQIQQCFCGELFLEKAMEKVIISIWAPVVAPRVCSRPREMCSIGQGLCNRLKESVTNVTWPGNQWHGVGNESCDGRGRPSQLLSLCVRSEYSLHPGSCLDLRGVLSAEASVAPGALLNRGKPTGAFSWKGLQDFRHSHHQLNQHLPTAWALLLYHWRTFLISKHGYVLTWEIKVSESWKQKKILSERGHGTLILSQKTVHSLLYGHINNPESSQLNPNYFKS